MDNPPMTRPDLVCFSHLRWDFVFQRPQHLMVRWAKDRRTFFFEEPRFSGTGPAELAERACASGVRVVTPRFPEDFPRDRVDSVLRALLDDLLEDHRIEDFVAWYYTPMMLSFTDRLHPKCMVYDCMDELSNFKGASPLLRDRERELMRKADLVFTGGQSLYEAKKDLHPNVHAFPSSVDTAHFAKARLPQADPADQAGIARPRVGFFGVIDERLDTELVAEAADLRPDWQFVILGPVVKIDPALLPRRSNVHYLGQKTYAELPAYLAGWDVAMLPFAHNDSTRFISPTKTPEYMAGGKPVVSTSIRDVVRPYGEKGLVRIADTPEDFVNAAAAALAEDAAGRLARHDAFLAALSWDETWGRMRVLVDGVAPGGRPRPTLVGVRANGNGAKGAHANGTNGKHAAVPSNGNGRANGQTNGFHAKLSVGRDHYDFLVVGAGFAGSVMAERLASAGKKVLLCDRRPHLGGNAYDHADAAGVLVHKYGPHIFHTNSAGVFDYLSRFTAWRHYEHRVLASVDGKLLPIPINLDTVNKLYGWSLDSRGLEEFFARVAEPRVPVRTSEDVIVSKVGTELYEKFFRNYTRKQWGLDPSELDSSVIARIPVRTNRDDRYFGDSYQAMPLDGFTKMFENMTTHPNIKIELGTDYRDLVEKVSFTEMVYSGPVDAFFDHCFGKLPYRSLEFRFETLNMENRLPVAVVNYPNEHAYTRVTEFKHLTGQKSAETSLVYEYPQAEGDPYYPIPRPENAELYRKYQTLAQGMPHVHFVGRLATYKYYNMDQVVAQALTLAAKIAGAARSELLAKTA